MWWNSLSWKQHNSVNKHDLKQIGKKLPSQGCVSSGCVRMFSDRWNHSRETDPNRESNYHEAFRVSVYQIIVITICKGHICQFKIHKHALLYDKTSIHLGTQSRQAVEWCVDLNTEHFLCYDDSSWGTCTFGSKTTHCWILSSPKYLSLYVIKPKITTKGKYFCNGLERKSTRMFFLLFCFLITKRSHNITWFFSFLQKMPTVWYRTKYSLITEINNVSILSHRSNASESQMNLFHGETSWHLDSNVFKIQ